MAVLLLMVGLAVLIASGTLLVDSASSLAERHNIPPAVIGLTLVAFGTSLPELAVNISASSAGNSDLSLGNVLGSNIANLGLVLGAALVIRGLNVESTIMRRELPLLLLGSMILVVLCGDGFLRGTAAQIDRADALVLLLLFMIFVYINLSDILVDRVDDALVVEALKHTSSIIQRRNYVFLAVGVVGLALGAQLTVDNAVVLAASMGVSQAIIGLSVVAVGTSLPELVTSIVAAWRGEASLAVGNVVGSNLINTLLILPISALILSIPVADPSLLDIWASLFFTVALCSIALLTNLNLNRFHGIGLLLAYAAYIFMRFAGVGTFVSG